MFSTIKENRMVKKVVFIGLCALAATSLGAFSACNADAGKFVTGEYSYTQYGTEYGVKVKVELESDASGEKIKSVKIVNSDYTEVSEGWDGKAVWNDNVNSLLNAYKGLYVADVLAKTVAVDAETGEPYVKEDSEFIDYGENLIISGATLGSSRLLLAVQNALQSKTE